MTAKGFLCLALLVMVMGCEASSPKGTVATPAVSDSADADKDPAVQADGTAQSDVGTTDDLDASTIEVLEQAWALYDQKRFQEAYDLIVPYASKPTASTYEICSAGSFADRTGRVQEAVGYQERCSAMRPGSFWELVLLVRAYEIVGDTEGRNAAYPQMIAAFEALPPAEQQDEDNYQIPRDRFEVGNNTVYTNEFLVRVGEGLVPRYGFYVTDAATEADLYQLILFFEEGVTEMKRNKGEIGPTDEMFALDHMDGSMGYQALVGFYLNEPSYDVLKADVIEWISEQ